MEPYKPLAEGQDSIEIELRSAVDVLRACHEGKALAGSLQFNMIDATRIATAISEIARNCVVHGGGGSILLTVAYDGRGSGLLVVARDRGRGIPDVGRALQDGYSTAGSLGIGLGVARRVMDEFNIVAEVGKGTTVTMLKWKR
ncbi:MAG TPA: anti-sigma regulatory factor [Noviherbaspirillum sp.]|uniref:anti-sigma regulatory factor n=1 Tax=Noviherbaspirillum sp. TaxID=1926288 RepID=UPI002D49B31D|nr:anti-sigma regulatory factor [Noviherbaspirillum sp.]HYD95335.1 anti-sigma regulatory factor [Noviherbaspirillum sp.]